MLVGFLSGKDQTAELSSPDRQKLQSAVTVPPLFFSPSLSVLLTEDTSDFLLEILYIFRLEKNNYLQLLYA